MLPWKLRKRQLLPVNQNLSSVHFSVAKFQLVTRNLSLAMIWQMTYNHKLPKLCSPTLNNKTTSTYRNSVEYIAGKSFLFISLKEKLDLTLFSVRRSQYFISHTKSLIFNGLLERDTGASSRKVTSHL